MKIFISWSGDRSHKLANTLRNWLPNVIQMVQPWTSTADIQPGIRWSNEIALQLQESNFGIICLTPDNIDAPWLLFEAGALSKRLNRTFVVPYLLGIKPSELKGPLVQFQVVTATKEDTFKLIRTINRTLGENALSDEVLNNAFEKWWPVLAEELTKLTQKDKSDKTKAEKYSVTHELGHLLINQGNLTTNDLKLLNDLVEKISGTQREQIIDNDIEEDRDCVFIVHGREHGIMEKVARFIERIGANAIVLHEQPNEGQTIIEKLELYSHAQYAIVLLTPDDRGGLSTVPFENQNARARQNVVMELGYFLAKLGRSRVCVLYQEGVEIPSDLSGIIYFKLDSEGAWKWNLARELKTASIRVDLNKAV
jgi:predicted nucleotide-binding protein